MVGTKFLVQWEEHPTHLATRLGYLLEHQSLVDVTLMCNTHTLKVHRSVLAACSPYFESVLQRQLGNQPLIVLKDMKFSVLKSLVEFMYCGETSVTEENLNPLMEAAKFFEVKGLSSMTKEAIGERSSTPLQSPVSSINGITPSGRGGRRPGAGRGRRPAAVPVTQAPLTNPPTESAQILLSLSGNPAQSLQTVNRNVRINPNSRISKVFTQDNNIVEAHKPYIRNGSLSAGDAGSRPVRGGYEPRRRGRRRNPANIAYNRTNLAYKDSEASRIAVENLQKEMDGQCDQKDRSVIDSKQTIIWNTNNVDKSPLLASLLSKAENFGSKIKTENEDSNTCENSIMGDGETLVYQVDGDTIQGNNMKYLEALKEAGLPTDVPILIDNGDGNYITLTEDVLMNVMEGKEEFQFQVTEGTLEGHEVGEGVVLQDGSIVMERKRNNDSLMPYGEKKENALGVRQFVVKEMQATKSDEEDLATVLSESVKKDCNKNGGKMSVQEIINEAVLESLKSDNKESEMDPDAVVLFEVTENSKVEKYVVSSKEVNVLKALNEQIVQRKKHLQDVKKTPLSPVGVIGGNTKIAEVKLTIGKSKSTKSILSQVLECAQEKLKQSNRAFKGPENIEKRDIIKGQSQLVELEFIDGNGEKIEGYQVEGTMITDKQFEEMNAHHSDNSTSKDDDVMHLLTLDNELSESDRIDENNIEGETSMDLVDATDRGKEVCMSHEKSDILEESYNEVVEGMETFEIDKGKREDGSLCMESTEHLNVNRVQNLVENDVQNLDDDTEVQNEGRSDAEHDISLNEDECKEMSVEQALEAMMGVDEAMLMKEDSNIDVEREDSSNTDTLEGHSNINGVEREHINVDVGREHCNVDVPGEGDSNIVVVETEDANIDTLERDGGHINVIERDNNLDIIGREASQPDIMQSELNEVEAVADCVPVDMPVVVTSESIIEEEEEEPVIENHSTEFHEYINEKTDVPMSKNNEVVIMEPVEEMMLGSLQNEEERKRDLLNDVLVSQDVKEVSEDDNVSSPTKDVPFAVGLLPLKTALEKIQTITEHQPRKTRSASMSKEDISVPKRRSSLGSNPHEPVDKKIKISEISDGSVCVSSEQIELCTEEVELCCDTSS
ncbi:uncharacterized protein LOC142322056 isoform X2 [Lycorma delicatula]